MSDPRLVEVTINVPDLDAAVEAWRTGIGLDAVIQPETRRASIDVQGITIVLVESAAESAVGLAGLVLGVEDLEALRASLTDIGTSGEGALALSPSATSGAPIELVETQAV